MGQELTSDQKRFDEKAAGWSNKDTEQLRWLCRELRPIVSGLNSDDPRRNIYDEIVAEIEKHDDAVSPKRLSEGPHRRLPTGSQTQRIDAILNSLSQEIQRTPTSEARNALTEANIQIMKARDLLQ